MKIRTKTSEKKLKILMLVEKHGLIFQSWYAPDEALYNLPDGDVIWISHKIMRSLLADGWLFSATANDVDSSCDIVELGEKGKEILRKYREENDADAQ